MPTPPRTTAVSSPGTKGAALAQPQRATQGTRVTREFLGARGPVGETAAFLSDYMVLPEPTVLVVTAWVAAAHLMDVWDKFPHLAVTSPEKRCGKTTLLDLLYLVTPRARYTTNISPAALYRVIQAEKPTLLMDESQSLARKGSEASEVIREILNAGIGKNAKVTRCGGERFDTIQEFSVFSPKVFALIGALDSVLADRCVPVRLERKATTADVQRYRSRVVEPRGHELREQLEQWCEANRDRVTEVYDRLEPFDINNDRMAELLMPLQAVLTVAAGHGANGLHGLPERYPRPTNQPAQSEALAVLQTYAEEIEARDREQEMQTPGVRLLVACRELFTCYPAEGPLKGKPVGFLATDELIARLVERAEEPWGTFNKGKPISREGLSNLLRPYGIKPSFNTKQTHRGYHASDFVEVFERYLPKRVPPLANPCNPFGPSNPKPNSKPPAKPGPKPGGSATGPKPGSFAEVAARRKAGGS